MSVGPISWENFAPGFFLPVRPQGGGVVSVLRELQDDLGRAVFDAYGWNDLASQLVGKPGATTPLTDKPAAQAQAEEELLSCPVKLNAERGAEEARGLVRWLRPDYQQKAAGITATQTEIETEDEGVAVAAKAVKRPWPKEAPAQARVGARRPACDKPGATHARRHRRAFFRQRPLARAPRTDARDAGRARQGARRCRARAGSIHPRGLIVDVA